MPEAARQQHADGEISVRTGVRAGARESAALALGGIAALLVGACCVGPLVLVAIGLGGAWLSNLTSLDPYRPVFAGIALISLAFAWRRIYRPAGECNPGEICAVPAIRTTHKIGFWAVVGLLVLMFGFPYIAPFFL